MQLAKSVAYPDGLRSAGSSYLPYLWPKLAVTQVIAAKDIVHSLWHIARISNRPGNDIESAQIQA